MPADRVGHVVMGMAQHSHRDSIYAAQGMRWRGGLPDDVPALTVARICGSGAEAIAVGAEIIGAGLRHDPDRPFVVVGGAESMQYPFTLWGMRGKKVGATVQKFGPVEARALPLREPPHRPAAGLPLRPERQDGDGQHRRGAGAALQDHRARRPTPSGCRSHRNARRARDAGWFAEEIAPVTVQRDGAAEPVDGPARHPHPRRRQPRGDGAPPGRLRGRAASSPPATPARWSTGRRPW